MGQKESVNDLSFNAVHFNLYSKLSFILYMKKLFCSHVTMGPDDNKMVGLLYLILFGLIWK